MPANLVRIDTIPDKWKNYAKESNINQDGSDKNGANKDWIDVKEAKILEQKLRSHFQIYGNGFDPIEGLVSSALTEIGINEALIENKFANIWNSFTNSCESLLRSTYKFFGF